jgi:hypothetical protein
MGEIERYLRLLKEMSEITSWEEDVMTDNESVN